MTWSPAGTPGATDTVIIGDGHTVTINQAVSVASITVGQGTSGVLTFDGVVARAVTVSGNVTVSTGATFVTQAAGAFTNTQTIGGDLTNNGTFDMSQNGTTLLCTVIFNKAGDQTFSGTPVLNRFRSIVLNKGAKVNRVISSSKVTMAGSQLFFDTLGTWEQTADTLFETSGSQTIGVNGGLTLSGSGTFHMGVNASIVLNGSFTVNTTGAFIMGTGANSFVSNATSTTAFTAGNVYIYGRLTLTGGTGSINGAAIYIDPQSTANLGGTSNCFEIGTTMNLTFSSGSVTIVDPNATVGGSGRELRFRAGGTNVFSGGTIYFGDGSSTTAGAGFRISIDGGFAPINNLTLQTGGSAGRDASMVSGMNVGGTLTFTGGTLTVGANTLTLQNPIAGTSTNLTAGSTSSIVLAGSASGVNLPSSVTSLNNLQMNNANGTTLPGNLNVAGTLTLSNGNVTTGGNTLTIALTGLVSRTSGHVVGNLQMNLGTGDLSATPFHMGTATDYTPVTVDIDGVGGTAGTLTATTTPSAHGQIGSSDFDLAKDVERFWTLTPGTADLGGRSYKLKVEFLPGDVPGGANTSNFVLRKYSGGNWEIPTGGSYTSTGTTTEYSNFTGFSDFAAGEAIVYDTITATAGANGSISPSGAVPILQGNDTSFTFTPDANYHVDSVFVDGSHVPDSTTGYTFFDVAGNHTIHVTFAIDQHTITASASAGGSIVPSGAVLVDHGADQQFTITPNSGYHLDDLLVNSVHVDSTTSYTFTNVQTDQTISALFELNVTSIQSNGTGGGEWNNTATWQGSVVPNGLDTVIILGSDSVYVSASDTCAVLTVQAGGKLGLPARLTVVNLTLNGKAVLYADTLAPSGTMTVGATGTYQHARDGGRLPRPTWSDGATLLVTGAVSATNVGGTPGQSYYNIVWNSPSQTANANLGMHPAAQGDTTTTVRGDLTVLSTGSGRLYLCGPPAGTLTTHTVARIALEGNLDISGTAQFSPHGSSSNYTDVIVTHLGNVNVTGGNFAISRGSQGGTGTTTWNLNAGNFAMSGATTQNSTTLAGGAKFVFGAAGVQNLSLLSVTFGTGGIPISVNSGTTLDVGTSMVRGSGIFTLNAGATIRCGNDGGLDSAIQNTGTKTLSAGATYVFNGSAPQITGVTLPASPANLTVNNASGVSLSAGTTVTGTFTLQSGNLSTGLNTLVIANGGSVSRISGHVVGNLQKGLGTGAGVAASFEIGDASNYTPVDVTFANISTGGDLLAFTTGTEHPSIGSSSIDETQSVNRFYTLTNSGIVFDQYDATFNFAASDVDGPANPSNFIVEKYDGLNWTGLTEGTRTATSTQILGATGFSGFAIGEVEPVTIVSNGTGGGSWTSSATWQGGVVPTSIDSVVILGTDSVYVPSTSSSGGLLVQAGGNLSLSAKLIPTNLALNGKAVVYADTLLPSGSATVGAAGVYQHARDGGRILRATWTDGSTLLITGVISTTNIGGSPGQSYYNIVWNSPGQTANTHMGMHPAAQGDTTTTIRGDITILSTGAARAQLAAPPAGIISAHTTARITITGSVNVSGTAQFTSHGTSSAYTDIIVSQTGNVNVTGGNFSISRGSQAGTGTTTWYMHAGNFSMSGATTQNSTSLAGGAKFVFDKAGTQTLALGSGNTLTALPIEVASGTTFDMGVSQIRGSGLFTLSAGATLRTANGGGLDSAVSITGTKTYNAGASYAYNGAVPQVSGKSLPIAMNNLTMDNASGMSLDTTTTVLGTLTLTSGNISTGPHTLSVGPGGSVSRTSGHVVGTLQKSVATGPTVSRTYEIGDAGAYTPVTITFASVGTAGALSAASNLGDHPNLGTSNIDPAGNVNRYWTMVNSGIVFTTYDGVFNFVPGDVDGGAVPSAFIGQKYDGAWSNLTEGTRTAASTEILGATSFSDFAFGDTLISTHEIAASAGPNGTIDPSGTVAVGDGANPVFTFTPSTGYNVDSIIVDGLYAGDSAQYQFFNVLAAHTIHVTFAINQYTLTVNVVGSGSVANNPDQLTYAHGSSVDLTPTPAVAWLFSAWSGDMTGNTVPLAVLMDGNKTITATFTEDPVYQVAYRTFRPDSIALDKDNFGKKGKYVKRKADKVYFKFVMAVPLGSPALTLKFGMLTSGAITRGTAKLETLYAWTNLKDVVMTPLDTVIQVDGVGFKGKAVKVSYSWATLPKATKGNIVTYLDNTPKFPMPNRVNALLETFEQGGFTGTSGLPVGIARSDSPKAYAWIRSPKYTDVLKTLSDKTGMHNLDNPWFLSYYENASAMKGILKVLPPAKKNNGLVANLMTLKLNIAASALQKTPAGFGELIYVGAPTAAESSANIFLQGKMIKDIADYADTVITGYYMYATHVGNIPALTVVNEIIKKLNNAFEGPLDTIDFTTKLHFKGTTKLVDVPYLTVDPSIPPTIIVPSSNPVAQVPDAYSLYQNYPNPFNPATTISFDLPEQAFVTLKVYNMLGQEVASLVDNQLMDDGTQEFQFDASNLSSGVYFYRIIAEGLDDDGAATTSFVTSRKMLLVK
jgi:hypothetical protein